MYVACQLGKERVLPGIRTGRDGCRRWVHWFAHKSGREPNSIRIPKQALVGRVSEDESRMFLEDGADRWGDAESGMRRAECYMVQRVYFLRTARTSRSRSDWRK